MANETLRGSAERFDRAKTRHRDSLAQGGWTEKNAPRVRNINANPTFNNALGAKPLALIDAVFMNVARRCR